MRTFLPLIFILLLSGFLQGEGSHQKKSDPQKETLLKPLWQYKLRAPSYGSGTVGDLNGDGKADVLFGTYYNDEHLYGLNGQDGTLLWKFKSDGGPLDASVALADVDGKGTPEVIFGDSAYGTIFCLDGKTGKALWKFKGQSGTDSPPAIGDVTGDGTLEVVYGTMWTWKKGVLQGGYVNVLSGKDGKLIWSYQFSKGCVQSAPCLIDLDGDGVLDIVVGLWRGENKIYALQGKTGKVLWTFDTDKSKTGMYHGVSAGDLDRDGIPEIVFTTTGGFLYVLDGLGGVLKWKKKVDPYPFAPVSLGDFTGNGNLEIAVTTQEVTLIHHTGKLLWQTRLEGRCERGTALADLDGDGKLDMVLGTSSRLLYVLRGWDGKVMEKLNLTCGKSPYERIGFSPLIIDLDGDGYLDVFVVCGKGTSGTSGEHHQKNNYGTAFAFSTKKGKGPGWHTFRGNLRRTGTTR